LVQVLTEPRNALAKQYQALFEMDEVELEFTPSALDAMASDAKKRRAGARGLRAILEETLLDIMYEIPSMDAVEKCIIDAPTVTDGEPPVLLDGDGSRVDFKMPERPAA
jgi:ATP-dependent Clp protease ATP-binding subunit ClpX